MGCAMAKIERMALPLRGDRLARPCLSRLSLRFELDRSELIGALSYNTCVKIADDRHIGFDIAARHDHLADAADLTLIVGISQRDRHIGAPGNMVESALPVGRPLA